MLKREMTKISNGLSNGQSKANDTDERLNMHARKEQ